MFRDPHGFPAWQATGLPVETITLSPTTERAARKSPRALTGLAIIWTLLGVFVGGLALNLTPCVYPLIPITVSYFGNQTGQSRSKLTAHGLLYLLGLALTNSILGVVASLTGGLMGSALQNPVVLVVVAAVLVVFATSLFGLWEIQLPSSITGAATKSYAGYFGSLFMGLTLGVVAAPCLGPFVLGLLTWVASLGDPFLGFLIFFTLSLGLGLPLLVLGLFSGSLDKLPRSGEWMLWLKKLMGWVLIGMAAYFIRSLLPRSMGVLLPAAVAFSAGLHLGWLDRAKTSFRGFDCLRTFAGTAGLVVATVVIGSWAMLGPGVSWQPYSGQLLADAQKREKPVIIDFSADWCTPCRKMDDVTFHDSAVVSQAEKQFVMVKVDLTRTGSPINERALARYGVKGVPTVIFLDSKGREIKELRVVDFLPPDRFLVRMARVGDS